jgi:hypothetical protein
MLACFKETDVMNAARYTMKLLVMIVIIAMSLSVTGCSSQQQTVMPSENTPAGPPDRVELVYFHKTNPCQCMKVVGDYIQQVVIFHFQEQVDQGTLTLKMITSDNPDNDALVKKFNSPPFELYIVQIHGETETIRSVPEIWGMTENKDKLAAYIKDQIQKALDGTL